MPPIVTKIRKQSIKNYFFERCAGGPKSKDFWPTIKPFLSKGTASKDSTIILKEEDKILTNQKEVANTFNKYFVNVAANIGGGCSDDLSTHPSIQAIRSNHQNIETFEFKHITDKDTSKYIDKVGINKATGLDNLSAKLIKIAKPAIARPLTNLVNKMINVHTFPTRLKEARLTPIFKKNESLDKQNYRPVSILQITSKIFERSINDQLSSHFEKIFSHLLSAFRSGYGCQSVLIKILEDWRQALDNNLYVASILMDLSKAFDCLPHDLLLTKLKAYGLSDSATDLVHSYLNNRKQCVSVGPNLSTFETIVKGVPQGSILGPLLFNIFINDIFLFVKTCDLYNYADDNTLSYADKDPVNLKAVLESESQNLIEWFASNQMKANPEKFQAIAIGKKSSKLNLKFDINSTEIKCDDEVKLLGVNVDYDLLFDSHIASLCKKASRQLNVLKRIGKYLNLQCRLMIYHTFILSNFNYCPIIWHFCSKNNTSKMEKIQERSLRFVYNDYKIDYNSLLEKSKLPTLHVRRIRNLALESYKIINKEGPKFLHELVNLKHCNYSFRYNIADIPNVKTSRYGINSFRYTAAKLWNDLPDNIRKASSFGMFRSMIKSWGGESCRCTACC